MLSPSPILAGALLLALFETSGCTTLANRRDLYFPGTVNGPYTLMKAHGIPRPQAVSGTVSSGDGKSVVKPAR